VGSRASSRLDRYAGIGLIRPDLEDEAVLLLVDSHLHSGHDDICPRCLTFIEERDFVRQTVYGLLQHEVCPP
jgi:hypothetical protein